MSLTSQPDILAGCWTQTSVAYNVEREKHVLLKDSWQALLDDILPEGQIYAELHSQSVPNIPHCHQAGDIGNELYHTSRSHGFNPEPGMPYHSPYLVPHRHYRLVLDTIGQLLKTFNHSWELVKAVHEALISEFAVCILFGGVA